MRFIITPLSLITGSAKHSPADRTTLCGWVASLEYGTHSMRRTKASLIYKATGNLRAMQILIGHTNIENTVRYLGVDVDDALTLSEQTDI